MDSRVLYRYIYDKLCVVEVTKEKLALNTGLGYELVIFVGFPWGDEN